MESTNTTLELQDPTSIFTYGSIVNLFKDWDTEKEFLYRARVLKVLEDKVIPPYEYCLDDTEPVNKTRIYSFRTCTFEILSDDLEPTGRIIKHKKRFLKRIGRAYSGVTNEPKDRLNLMPDKFIMINGKEVF